MSGSNMMQMLEKVPRAELERAVERSAELGASAFKSKEYKAALGYYDTTVQAHMYLDAKDQTPLLKALSNRSACHLALGAAAKAFDDASDCVKLRAGWQKGWYRLGRALYEQGKVLEAEAAFAEGIQIDITNAEMLRWRQLSRDRIADLKTLEMKRRRHCTDYSKFGSFEEEEETGKMRSIVKESDYSGGGAPVVETVEEMHDLMERKQRAQMSLQKPTDVYFRQDMIMLPQTETPAELEEEGAMTVIVTYLEQLSALGLPRRCVDNLSTVTGVLAAFTKAIKHVGSNLQRLELAGDWLHLGVGTGVPLLVTASLPVEVAPRISVLSAHAAPFVDSLAVHLMSINKVGDRVKVIRKPVEDLQVAVQGSTEEEALPGPALILVLDPGCFDAGLLGRRVLPYVRHARRSLCIPTPLVLPSVARVFAVPIAVHSPSAAGFDIMAELDEYRWGPCYEEFDLVTSIQAERGGINRSVFEPQEVFCFDFAAEDLEKALPVAAEQLLHFEVATEDAEINGVAFWFELQLLAEDDEVVTNKPGSTSLWKQAVQWVDPVNVKKGSTMDIRASHNSTRVRFQITSPERLTPCVHRHSLSRWHFEMVADDIRNRAFDEAIKAAVSTKENCQVVDFGTGTGLLALMAARAGAHRVTGFDNQGHVVEVARRLVKKHGHSRTVKIVQKDCRHLVMGTDLKSKCDLLVMELFDYGFLGEGALHFIHFAWTNCLQKDAVVVPRGGRVFAVVVSLLLAETEFDLGAWETYRFSTDYYGLDLLKTPHKKLTETFEVFSFDFSREATLKRGDPRSGDDWAASLPIIESGTANAVVFWHEMDMYPGQPPLKTEPGAQSCWYQACQPIEGLVLTKGFELPLKASHDGSRITFGVDRSQMADYADLRSKAPLFDPLWLSVNNRLMEQSAALNKTMAFNNSARQQATDAMISVAVDPARLARSGRYVDPTQALHMALGLFSR